MADGSDVLIDSFGRIATDLRVSVTDRCDLRCTYCMPEEGLDWTPPAELLSFDEIERLVRIFQNLGVKTLRLTGGEPLMRKGLPDLISRLDALGLDDLSMTTNATTLARHAAALKESGLKRVNISLDSLDRHKFTMLTRRDKIDNVLEGIAAAAAVGLQPIKVNCVVVRGVNESEAVEFATLARKLSIHVRFIEFMPLDADENWKADQVVPTAELVADIRAQYPLQEPVVNGPSTVYAFTDEAGGSVGFIGSVTEPFCDACDRLRLSADGKLQTCLFAREETDLRVLLRSDATDEDIANTIKDSVAHKQAGHGIGTKTFVRPPRSMSMIGG